MHKTNSNNLTVEKKIKIFLDENTEFNLQKNNIICSICKKTLRFNRKTIIPDLIKHQKTKKHLNNINFFTKKILLIYLKQKQ